MWQSWHQTLHPLANHWCSWWSSGQQSCTCGPIGELSISWWFVNVLTLYVAYQTAQIAYEEPPSVRGTKKKVAVATKVCTFEFECMSIFQYIYSDMYWWLFVPSKRGCLDWPNPLRHVEYFDSATYRKLLELLTSLAEKLPPKLPPKISFHIYKLPMNARGMLTKMNCLHTVIIESFELRAL